MRQPDHLLDSDVAAVVVADAERAIPAGTTVLPAVMKRVAPAGGRRSRRGLGRLVRSPALVALASAVLVAVIVTSPLAQAATSTISSWLLRTAGLSSAEQGQIQHPTGVTSATSAGYTVTLTGVYGDQFRTILFFDSSPAAFVTISQVTDETGHALGGGGGAGGLDGSEFEFDPLTPGRHVLTVHVSSLMVQSGVPAQPAPGFPPVPPAAPVAGEWTLRFPLDVGTAATVGTVPASGDLGRVHVSVAGVVSNGGSLFMRVETTGATADELGFEVLDARGRPVPTTQAGGAASKSPAGLRTLTWTLYAKELGSGAYRLVVTFQGQRFESRFTIR